MKKIVVVVDGSPIRFNEEQTSAYYDADTEYLMVNDTSKTPPQKIAGFTKWDYWYYDAGETQKTEQKDILEKWFFENLIYSPRLQEPRCLTQDYLRLEDQIKIWDDARRLYERVDDNMENPMVEKIDSARKKQEKIKKDIVGYFKETLPQILAYKYIGFFPKSKWYGRK